jgi:2-keto-4-pentenoate hydratase/2-oxohepta-3-ene-1,7-dioic acid hydratase in catechol pathway
MRLVRYVHEKRPYLGYLEGDHILPLQELSEDFTIEYFLWMKTMLRSPARRRSASDPARLPLTAVELHAPVRPGKIVAVGRNYADHAAETGTARSEKPRIIAKLPGTVIGPGQSVRIPDGVTKVDYEIELGVVIGERASRVPRQHALDFVAGYTILNDISAREFQFDVSPPQTTFAKSMDTFCPMGPCLTLWDEIPDPQSLSMELRVNDEVMQQANTRDMIFSVAELIEYITRFITLHPGDVIATGTPAGVGAFRNPPRWLQPGDRLRLEIERIGVLEHTVSAVEPVDPAFWGERYSEARATLRRIGGKEPS